LNSMLDDLGDVQIRRQVQLWLSYRSFVPATVASTMLVSSEKAPLGRNRSPAVPAPIRTEKPHKSHVSDIQRERAEMSATFEVSSNLPLLVFARLAGKSRDQINRDIKARRLLLLSQGNRGQRIPYWQLDPWRHKFDDTKFKAGLVAAKIVSWL